LTISAGNDRTTFYLSGSSTTTTAINRRQQRPVYPRNTVRFRGSHRSPTISSRREPIPYADTRGSFIQRGNNVNGIQLSLLRSRRNFKQPAILWIPQFGLASDLSVQAPGAGTLSPIAASTIPSTSSMSSKNRSVGGTLLRNINAEYTAARLARGELYVARN